MIKPYIDWSSTIQPSILWNAISLTFLHSVRIEKRTEVVNVICNCVCVLLRFDYINEQMKTTTIFNFDVYVCSRHVIYTLRPIASNVFVVCMCGAQTRDNNICELRRRRRRRRRQIHLYTNLIINWRQSYFLFVCPFYSFRRSFTSRRRRSLVHTHTRFICLPLQQQHQFNSILFHFHFFLFSGPNERPSNLCA